jgi:hypothetical protein
MKEQEIELSEVESQKLDIARSARMQTKAEYDEAMRDEINILDLIYDRHDIDGSKVTSAKKEGNKIIIGMGK